GEPDFRVESKKGRLRGAGFSIRPLAQLTFLVLREVQLPCFLRHTFRREDIANGTTQTLNLIGGWHRNSDSVLEQSRFVALLLEQLAHNALLFCLRPASQLKPP